MLLGVDSCFSDACILFLFYAALHHNVWLVSVITYIWMSRCRSVSDYTGYYVRVAFRCTYVAKRRTRSCITTYHLISRNNMFMSTWAPFQYAKRRLIARSREVSKPRDLCLELSDCYEIWQAPLQHCCRCAVKFQSDTNILNTLYRALETLRDLTISVLSDIETGPWSSVKYHWHKNICHLVLVHWCVLLWTYF